MICGINLTATPSRPQQGRISSSGLSSAARRRIEAVRNGLDDSARGRGDRAPKLAKLAAIFAFAPDRRQDGGMDVAGTGDEPLKCKKAPACDSGGLGSCET